MNSTENRLTELKFFKNVAILFIVYFAVDFTDTLTDTLRATLFRNFKRYYTIEYLIEKAALFFNNFRRFRILLGRF